MKIVLILLLIIFGYLEQKKFDKETEEMEEDARRKKYGI